MAGSELEGLDGADADMFSGAVWVLTPTAATSHTAIAAVASAVTTLGAEMVAMAPERHDEMVAVVSHVPHLTAASLMGLAADGADEHAALLRLAAGGFRDMTRIASGHPDIWLDICDQNRDAIVVALDRLIDRLGEMREIVGSVDRHGLLERLQRARLARTNLPGRITRPETLAEVRIPIPDRPGAAAEIFTLAAREGINIASFEVVHLAESNLGVAVVLVDADSAETYRSRPRRAGPAPGGVATLVKHLRAAAGPVHGDVTVPGSKSIANRALVAAALAHGRSRLTNVPDGDDTAAMLRCLAGLGVDLEARQDGTVTVAGTAANLGTRPAVLDAGLAGTTSRFITAVAALAGARDHHRRCRTAAHPADGRAARGPGDPRRQGRAGGAGRAAARHRHRPDPSWWHHPPAWRRLQPVRHRADADRTCAAGGSAPPADVPARVTAVHSPHCRSDGGVRRR